MAGTLWDTWDCGAVPGVPERGVGAWRPEYCGTHRPGLAGCPSSGLSVRRPDDSVP